MHAFTQQLSPEHPFHAKQGSSYQGYNQQIKEKALQQTQQEINGLINTTYAIENKIENNRQILTRSH